MFLGLLGGVDSWWGIARLGVWRVVGPLCAPSACYIGWLVGLVSLWAQLVRVPRLCFWRVYPKALGSIGGCLESGCCLGWLPWLLPLSEHIGRDTWHVDYSCSDARVFA